MLEIEKALQRHEKANQQRTGENFYSKYKLAEDRLLKVEYSFTMAGFRGGNDHGPHHILRVLEYLDKLLGKRGLAALDSYELFLTAMSILYHDLGLLHQRKKHSEISAHLLNAEQSGYLFDPHDKEFMTIAIKDHSSDQSIDDDCADLNPVENVRGHDVRVRLVAALVRLADELDEDHRRAPENLLERLVLPNESKFYWNFNQRIQSVKPDLPSRSIRISVVLRDEDGKLSFIVDDQSQGFIDLMMRKIIKINNERAYCNQFFPDRLKYNETILIIRPKNSKQAGWKPKDIVLRDRTSFEDLIDWLPEPLRQGSKKKAQGKPPATESDDSLIARLMEGVSFAKAHRDLVAYCLALKENVSREEQEQLALEVRQLRDGADTSEWVKLQLLGKILLKAVGRDILITAMNTAGPHIKQ